MSKLIITEAVLKNLIHATIKEVLGEANFEPMSMKDRMAGVPDPKDNPLSLGARQYEREEERIKAASTKCLKGLSDEEIQAAYAHYKKNEMPLGTLPTPENFVASMNSDSDGRMYLNGMMFAYQAGDHPASSPASASWLLHVSDLLPDNCEPEGL